MKREGLTRALLASVLLAFGACDSWHGDNQGSPSPGGGDKPPTTKPDAGSTPKGDSGSDQLDAEVALPVDAAVDAGEADAGLPPPIRGDERAGHVACNAERCEASEVCCAGRNEKTPACGGHCGGTEHAITCDGPEDCGSGQVCCLQVTDGRRTGLCIAAEEEGEGDAGVATLNCTDVSETQPGQVACHVDADCATRDQTPVCRQPAGAFSGYGACAAVYDDPTTPGHDDMGRVRCGAKACGAPGELCCASATAAGVAACGRDDALCGRTEYPVTCDGPEDCRGTQVCCFVPAGLAADAGVTSPRTECAERCPADAVQRCHQDVDCGGGRVCVPESESVSFWGRCAPGMPPG